MTASGSSLARQSRNRPGTNWPNAKAPPAIALIRMDKAKEIWSLFRHSPDPQLGRFIVNGIGSLGVDPKRLLLELDQIDAKAKPTPAQGQQMMDARSCSECRTSIRRALILALATLQTKRYPRPSGTR